MPETIEELRAKITIGEVSDKEIDDAINKVLDRTRKAWSRFDGDVGRVKRQVKLRLKPGERPAKARPIPIKTEKGRQQMKEIIDTGLANGTFRRSHSEWAAPAFLVVKPRSDKMRMVIDFRRLNSKCEADAYPMPTLTDILDSVSGAKLFSKLDIVSAFQHMPIVPEDQPLTAFTTPFGLFECTSSLFGHKNAPAEWNRAMQEALDGCNDAVFYMDDVMIATPDDPKRHLAAIEDVLERLIRAGIKCKLSKTELFQREVEFLGFSISADGVKPTDYSIQKALDVQRPTTEKELWAFIGTCGWLANFIPRFSEAMKPFNDLKKRLNKKLPFSWTDELEKAFGTIKNRVAAIVRMQHFVPGAPTVVYTDASSKCLGGVIYQYTNGEWRIFRYDSKTLTDTQSRYSAQKLELFGVIWMLDKYERYLLNQHFLLFTDHNNLIPLFDRSADLNRQMRAMAMKLAPFDFTIAHVDGVINAFADGLSRLSVQLQPANGKGTNITKEDAERLTNTDVPIIDRATKTMKTANATLKLPHDISAAALKLLNRKERKKRLESDTAITRKLFDEPNEPNGTNTKVDSDAKADGKPNDTTTTDDDNTTKENGAPTVEWIDDTHKNTTIATLNPEAPEWKPAYAWMCQSRNSTPRRVTSDDDVIASIEAEFIATNDGSSATTRPPDTPMPPTIDPTPSISPTEPVSAIALAPSVQPRTSTRKLVFKERERKVWKRPPMPAKQTTPTPQSRPFRLKAGVRSADPATTFKPADSEATSTEVASADAPPEPTVPITAPTDDSLESATPVTAPSDNPTTTVAPVVTADTIAPLKLTYANKERDRQLDNKDGSQQSSQINVRRSLTEAFDADEKSNATTVQLPRRSARQRAKGYKHAHIDVPLDNEAMDTHTFAQKIDRAFKRGGRLLAIEDLQKLDMKDQQLLDTQCATLIMALRHPDRMNKDDFDKATLNRIRKKIWHLSNDGILMRENRVVIPTHLITTYLWAYHEGPSTRISCHPGAKALTEKLKQLYYWECMDKDIADYVRSCPTCQEASGNKRDNGGVPSQPQATHYNQRVHVDCVGPLPTTSDGYTCLLSLTDEWSGYNVLTPMRDQSASTTAIAIFDNWIAPFGQFHCLISDNGNNFTSRIALAMEQMFGYKQVFTSIYCPQSNGKEERRHQELYACFRIMLDKGILKAQTPSDDDEDDYPRHEPDDWKTLTATVQGILNARIGKYGHSPNHAMFLNTIHSVTDAVMFPLPLEQSIAFTEDMTGAPAAELQSYHQQIETRTRLMREVIAADNDLYKEQRRRSENKDAADHRFQIGQYVRIYTGDRAKGINHKMRRRWEGPYLITDLVGNRAVEVTSSTGSDREVLHIRRIAPYYFDTGRKTRFANIDKPFLAIAVNENQREPEGKLPQELAKEPRWILQRTASSRQRYTNRIAHSAPLKTPEHVCELIATLVPTASIHVIELFAGEAPILLAIAKKLKEQQQARFIAVELDEERIAKAKKANNSQDGRITHFHQDVLSRDFNSTAKAAFNRFDVVVANPPFEYDIACARIASILVRPGGSILLLLPADWPAKKATLQFFECTPVRITKAILLNRVAYIPGRASLKRSQPDAIFELQRCDMSIPIAERLAHAVQPADFLIQDGHRVTEDEQEEFANIRDERYRTLKERAKKARKALKAGAADTVEPTLHSSQNQSAPEQVPVASLIKHKFFDAIEEMFGDQPPQRPLMRQPWNSVTERPAPTQQNPSSTTDITRANPFSSHKTQLQRANPFEAINCRPMTRASLSAEHRSKETHSLEERPLSRAPPPFRHA